MTGTVPSRVLMLLPDEDAPIISKDLSPRLAAMYYQLRDSGFELVFATRSGGYSAAMGEMRRFADHPVVTKLMADALARDELSESLALERVYVDDFDVMVLFLEGTELALPEVRTAISEFQDIGKAVVAFETLDPVDDALPRIRAIISQLRS